MLYGWIGFKVFFIQLVFLLVCMFSELKFTPLLFVDGLVMIFWLPCMTTKVKANRFMLDVICVIIRSMFMCFMVIIIAIIVD